jgi:molybdopterin molybdotransferase
MVEDTLVNTDGTVSYTGKALPHTCDTAHKVPNNIRYCGEDLKAGDCILGGGQIINPAIVASLATIGCTHPEVFTRPKVAVISTGNELVEPGMSLREGTIRNSNGPQLVAQLLQSGAEPIYMGIAPDDKEATAAMLQQAMQQADMILFSGGVSMGDFDFVPEVLVEAGFEIDFDSVAVQPGKPTLFAHKGAQFCFGLPGNPVSAYIQFELLVTPLICRMSGHTIHTKDILLPLADDFQRSKAKRHSWIPVAIINGTIHKIRYNGSGHISALAQADGFISFPIGISHLKKGELTNVRQI